MKPIGKVLAFDQSTLSLARPGVARVCVEVNLLVNNPSRIWLDLGDVGARWQKIVYEKSKKICKSCRKQGHGEEDCRKKKFPNQPDDSEGKNIALKEIAQVQKPAYQNKGKKSQHVGINVIKEGLNMQSKIQRHKGIWKQQNPRKDSGGNPLYSAANQRITTNLINEDDQAADLVLEDGMHADSSVYVPDATTVVQH